MNYLLTVIVPVYNQASYLKPCVDSILQQDVPQMQVILIDDGSTDASPSLCDAFAAQDGRVCVVHQANGGLLASRKRGIAEADGTFIVFVDADDWLEPGCLCSLLAVGQQHPEVDIIAGSMTRVYADGSRKAMFPRAQAAMMTNEAALGAMFRQRLFGWHLAGKLYRRSLFRDWQPDERIVSGEDLHGNGLLLRHARRVACQPGASYCYRMHDASLTAHSTMELDLTPVYEHMLQHLWVQDAETLDLLRESYLYDLVRQYREMFFTDAQGYAERLASYAGRMQRLAQAIAVPRLFSAAVLDFYRQPPEVLSAQYAAARREMLATAQAAFHTKKPVYLYGAGIAAKCYLLLFQQEGLPCAGCVVSDGQAGPGVFQGAKVYPLSDVHGEAAFVLALNARYVPAVTEALHQAGQRDVFHRDAPEIFAGLAVG